MGSLVKRDLKIEKNKRYLAMGVTGLGVAATVAGPLLLGLPIVAAGVYLGYDWFKFRAKRGMRF
jgi:hypothetical protein